MPKSSHPPDLKAALSEIEKIVSDLEGNEMSLDSSIEQYERGIALIRQSQLTLNEMQNRVQQIGELDVSTKQADREAGSCE